MVEIDFDGVIIEKISLSNNFGLSKRLEEISTILRFYHPKKSKF